MTHDHNRFVNYVRVQIHVKEFTSASLRHFLPDPLVKGVKTGQPEVNRNPIN